MKGGLFHLVRIPIFEPTATDAPPSPSIYINSLANEPCLPAFPKSPTAITVLDLVSPRADPFQGGLVKHTFPQTGPKSKPIGIEVNGRRGRRAVCALYADGLRYEVFDLDAEAQDEEGIEE